MTLGIKIIKVLKENGPLRPTEIAKILSYKRAEIAAECLCLINTQKLELTSDLKVKIPG